MKRGSSNTGIFLASPDLLSKVSDKFYRLGLERMIKDPTFEVDYFKAALEEGFDERISSKPADMSPIKKSAILIIKDPS